MDTAILYYTNHGLPGNIEKVCQEQLLKAAEDIPIFCVSQVPLDFGYRSIAVGIQPASHQSMIMQMRTGLDLMLKEGRPKMVFCVEHDCLYPEGYFNEFHGVVDDWTYYYYANKYYLNENGYAFSGLYNLSTLVCDFRILLGHLNLRLYRTIKLEKAKGGWPCSEPGLSDATGKIDARCKYLEKIGTPNQRGEYAHHLQIFPLSLPVIDIRHGLNLSKVNLDNYGYFSELKYWGHYKDWHRRLNWFYQ